MLLVEAGEDAPVSAEIQARRDDGLHHAETEEERRQPRRSKCLDGVGRHREDEVHAEDLARG